MIYINSNQDYIRQLAENWSRKLEMFLTRVGRYWIEYTPIGASEAQKVYYDTYKDKMYGKVALSKLDEDEKSLCEQYLNTFLGNLSIYAMAWEDGLQSIHDKYKEEMLDNPTKQKTHAHNLLSSIFMDLYEDFVKSKPIFDDLDDPDDIRLYSKESIAYYFFYKLDMRTCPYCNRNYTFTVHDDDRQTRPEYDHFYDKANNPLLAASFYNLVPSCHTCNHVKGNRKLYVNPYFHGFTGQFRIKHDGRFDDYKTQIIAETDDMHTLGLDLLYPLHEDYVQEIFEKAQAYNKHARESLVDSFQGAGESPDRVFEFVWGKHLEEAKLINRPLSKLTRDILEQLGIIDANERENS